MVPITRADEELFGTVLVAARLGRAHRIVEDLRVRYEEDWEDPLAGFPYALSMLAQLQVSPEGTEVGMFAKLVETLGDVVYGTPDHWLGRYLRIRMRSLIPLDHSEGYERYQRIAGPYPELHDSYRAFAEAEKARAGTDVEELIARQSASAWQPWYACTYLLAARLEWESADRDPDRVAQLAAQATAAPGAPIPFRALGTVLCEAFVWYCHEPDVPGREAVVRTLRALFPANATLAGTAPAAVR